MNRRTLLFSLFSCCLPFRSRASSNSIAFDGTDDYISLSSISASKWVHVSMTYRRGEIVNVYINGQRVS